MQTVTVLMYVTSICQIPIPYTSTPLNPFNPFNPFNLSKAPDSPTAGLVCQMAELSADLHALDKATHEETATMVQMPLSSVELGQSTEKMKSFLTKSIKAFEGFKPKGSFGHFGLAKARREMHIKLCKYMSDLYVPVSTYFYFLLKDTDGVHRTPHGVGLVHPNSVLLGSVTSYVSPFVLTCVILTTNHVPKGTKRGNGLRFSWCST